MNYYELIYLKDILKVTLENSYVTLATTHIKNVIEFYLECKNEPLKLVFSTAPGNIALYFADSVRVSGKNRIQFFDAIYNKPIQDVRLAPNDRVLEILFGERHRLIFTLYGSQANAYLAEGEKLLELFKEGTGSYALPVMRPVKPAELKQDMSAEEVITALDGKLPRRHLRNLVEIHELQHADKTALSAFVERLRHSLLNQAEFRILADGSDTIINEELLPLKTDRKFTSVNDFIAFRYIHYVQNRQLRQEREEYAAALAKQLSRLDSSLKNLKIAQNNYEHIEAYEKFGHLLMAQAHRKVLESAEFITPDFYDNNKLINVPVNPDLSIAENAQKYYQKAKHAAVSYKAAVKQIPILQEKKEEVMRLSDTLNAVTNHTELRDWVKTHKAALSALLPQKNAAKTKQAVPFHTFEVDGYPVWIGKNAHNNDLLLQSGHKEDVWLHARGVSGSHALIRMENRHEMPPNNVIEKAAAYAAYNSKAAGAKLVPVIFTKKKFVRKPKQANPGAVVVEKEEVVFVNPENPVV